MDEKGGSPHQQNLPPSRHRRSAGTVLADVDELEVVVEKLVAGGTGLSRWRGVPIFVPRSAPGDRLRVRLVERRPDYGRAEILEILEAGRGRRPAPCAYFGQCGGCDLQHLDDDLQSDLKADAVRETLRRLGGIDTEGIVKTVKGEAWAYRQRAQLHTELKDGEMRVGFRPRRGHDLVAVDSCPILVPDLDSQLGILARNLPADPPRRVDLVVGDGGRLSTAPRTPALPHGEVEITVGDIGYQLDARCFFQSHQQLLPRLVQEVVGSWQGDTAYDLYSGVGLFSLPLAELYGNVVAVEGDNVAGRYLKRNARRNRLENCRLVRSAVESWIGRLPEGADRVIVDPPRTGLSKKVCNTLSSRRPRRLTYVSCHAATLARDLKSLTRMFEVEEVVLLDLFPQTGHMEAVTHLVCR